MRLARNLLAARQESLDFADIDDGRPALKPDDRAADDSPFNVLKFVVQRIAFGFADLLNHHLLGSLSGNATENVADDFRVKRLAVAVDAGFAGLAVDVDFQFVIFAKVLARSGQDRLFDSLKHDLFVDVLVAMNCVDDSQYFCTVHLFRFPVRRQDPPGSSPIRSSRVGMRSSFLICWSSDQTNPRSHPYRR